MSKLRVKITCILSLSILFLAACAAPSPQAPAVKPTQAPTPVIPETGNRTPAPAKEACSQLPLTEALIANSWSSSYNPPRLAAIDPSTGQELCGFSALPQSGNQATLISPGHRYLAWIDVNLGSGNSEAIQFVDLSSGKNFSIPYSIENWVSSMAFSPDSSLLAVAYAFGSGPAYNTGQAFKLAIVDVDRKQVIGDTQLDFNPWLLQFTSDGAQIVAYGGPEYAVTESPGSSPVIPDAQGITLKVGDLKAGPWKIPLAGIPEGTVYSSNNSTNSFVSIRYYSGVALSPDDRFLYIVHATENRLTTVDLQEKTVKTVDIQAPQTWIERLLSLGAGVAQAKAMNTTSKKALLSPDGKSLYVLGVQESYSEDGKHSLTSQGLQVLQAQTGQEIRRLDQQATHLALSPDGRQIYLGSDSETGTWSEAISSDDYKTIARFDGQGLLPIDLGSGKEVLLTSKQEGSNTKLTLLDPSTLQPIASWTWKGVQIMPVLEYWSAG